MVSPLSNDGEGVTSVARLCMQQLYPGINPSLGYSMTSSGLERPLRGPTTSLLSAAEADWLQGSSYP